MSSFRFLHAADIHLDSPLRGLSKVEGFAADRVRQAPREALSNLVTTAIERDADFMVIAGDLYDGDWRDFNTGLFFVKEMARLTNAGIRVFVLYGNHDAESRLTKSLTLPEGVRVFSSRKPETIHLEGHGVVLHGQSFHHAETRDDLSKDYATPVKGAFNIGVLHTALGGTEGHANYAPCSLGDLVAKGYDYWALGHVHKGGILNEHPHIVFPGNLQGRHVRESGAKGARLVTVTDGAVSAVEFVGCDVVRWDRLEIDLTDCARLHDVYARMQKAIEDAATKAEDRLLACRIELRGQVHLHANLAASRDELQAEARAAALRLGEDVASIEKVILATTPRLSREAVAARQDALGELAGLLARACHDPALLDRLVTDLGTLVSKLPSELKETADDALTQAVLKQDYEGAVRQSVDHLLAQLAGQE